uniref:Uncharacterized protein n=1 Tax=Molossus molossus TaxID=27622 RepID=A0A7J8BL07_MOLMO|nr:hypothetical protein HJG59_010204 [Molossus molossus]
MRLKGVNTASIPTGVEGGTCASRHGHLSTCHPEGEADPAVTTHSDNPRRTLAGHPDSCLPRVSPVPPELPGGRRAGSPACDPSSASRQGRQGGGEQSGVQGKEGALTCGLPGGALCPSTRRGDCILVSAHALPGPTPGLQEHALFLVMNQACQAPPDNRGRMPRARPQRLQCLLRRRRCARPVTAPGAWHRLSVAAWAMRSEGVQGGEGRAWRQMSAAAGPQARPRVRPWPQMHPVGTGQGSVTVHPQRRTQGAVGSMTPLTWGF